MSRPAISFNGSDWETTVPGLKIVSTDPYRAPNRDVVTNKIARTNKSVTSAAWWRDKKFNVSVEIGRDTRELLDDAVDAFKAILQAREATLLSNYGSSTRQWTATVDNIAITQVKGGHCIIDVEFEVAEPHGFDTASITLVTGSQTGASRTDNFTLLGSAEKQLPVITITLTTVTPGASHGITLTNPATGQAIVINRTTGWTAADVLVVDTAQKLVTLNGAAIAFTGPIPEWDKGAGSLQYADTFTSRKFTIGVSYRKRWL
jgi:phage-related protein